MMSLHSLALSAGVLLSLSPATLLADCFSFGTPTYYTQCCCVPEEVGQFFPCDPAGECNVATPSECTPSIQDCNGGDGTTAYLPCVSDATCQSGAETERCYVRQPLIHISTRFVCDIQPCPAPSWGYTCLWTEVPNTEPDFVAGCNTLSDICAE